MLYLIIIFQIKFLYLCFGRVFATQISLNHLILDMRVLTPKILEVMFVVPEYKLTASHVLCGYGFDEMRANIWLKTQVYLFFQEIFVFLISN